MNLAGRAVDRRRKVVEGITKVQMQEVGGASTFVSCDEKSAHRNMAEGRRQAFQALQGTSNFLFFRMRYNFRRKVRHTVRRRVLI
jgi:hypothetical protein